MNEFIVAFNKMVHNLDIRFGGNAAEGRATYQISLDEGFLPEDIVGFAWMAYEDMIKNASFFRMKMHMDTNNVKGLFGSLYSI